MLTTEMILAQHPDARVLDNGVILFSTFSYNTEEEEDEEYDEYEEEVEGDEEWDDDDPTEIVVK